MTKKTYTCTDPNGHQHKRGTERTYTHAILARPDHAHAVKEASDKGWAKVDADNYRYYAGEAGPSPKYSHSPNEMATIKALVAAHPTVEDYVAAKLAERLGRVSQQKEAGYYDNYFTMGWAGRPDLAQKERAKHAKNPRFNSVVIADAVLS